MFDASDANDKHLELGFVKLQLYDRMVDLCGQSMTLFAAMLENMELDAAVKNVINQIGTEMHSVLTKEQELQSLMEKEILKRDFGRSTIN